MASEMVTKYDTTRIMHVLMFSLLLQREREREREREKGGGGGWVRGGDWGGGGVGRGGVVICPE